MPQQTFYGQGKLLLTSEYFVLDGAQALAVPTRFGQRMSVAAGDVSSAATLKWTSVDHAGKLWLSASFDLSDFAIKNSEDERTIRPLREILRAARTLNSEFLTGGRDIDVTTTLEFPSDWGLGSSSTLIYMVGQWAEVCPFKLLEGTFGGSGYDIACAGAPQAILYQVSGGMPKWSHVTFNPPFTEHLYFAHLNRKQNSRHGIRHYREVNPSPAPAIKRLNQIAQKMLKAAHLEEFDALLAEHEELIAKALNLSVVKEALFADYWGQIKSLGAWGGDFVLATSDRTRKETNDYFHRRGYKTVLSYDELIL